MPTKFVSWTCVASEGYHPAHPPSGAKKAYNALIRGRDQKNTFVRDFVGRTFVVDRTTVPALLESRDVDKRGRADDTYILLLAGEGEECLRHCVTKTQAVWLATQIDLGRKLEECWDPILVSSPCSERVVRNGMLRPPLTQPAPTQPTPVQELRQALLAALRYIDALPSEVVAALPAMPGFDRDQVDALLETTRES